MNDSKSGTQILGGWVSSGARSSSGDGGKDKEKFRKNIKPSPVLAGDGATELSIENNKSTPAASSVATGFVWSADWHVDDNLDVSPGSGSCNSDGYWVVEAWLDHQSFWCSRYKLGIQFGNWNGTAFIALTPVFWGPDQEHCNGARNQHNNSGGPAAEIISNFFSINTAQRWVQRL